MGKMVTQDTPVLVFISKSQHLPVSEASYFPMGPPVSFASMPGEVHLPRSWAKTFTAMKQKTDFGSEEREHLMHVLETYGGVPVIGNVLTQITRPSN